MSILVWDHLDGEERELAALLSLSSWCLVIVHCCVVIPISAMGLSAVCDCDTHSLFLGVIHATSDGFGHICLV